METDQGSTSANGDNAENTDNAASGDKAQTTDNAAVEPEENVPSFRVTCYRTG